MKLAILGDVHLGCRGDGAGFHDHFESFYRDVFYPYLKDNNITTVLQVGDMFDKKKSVNFYTLSRAKEYFFRPAEKLGIEIICNVGNHDSYHKHSLEINAPDLLTQEFSNVFIIDSPTERTFGGTKFLLMPWICRDNEKETFDLIAKTKAQIAVGHLELAGFAMYKGIVNEHGMSSDLFSKFDMVLTGHYHHKSTHGNITYVGTPYEITWSDCDDPRGFHIFDTDTRELTFIKNPYTMFEKIKFDDENRTLEDMLDFPFECYKNKYVKVIVAKKESQNTLDIFVKELEKAGAFDVSTTDNTLVMELSTDEVDDVEDTLSIIKGSVGEIETSVDKQRLTDMLIDLYIEAKSIEI